MVGPAKTHRGIRTFLAVLTMSCGQAASFEVSDNVATEPDQAMSDDLLELEKFEKALRSTVDFAKQKPSSVTLGANPYDVRSVPGTHWAVGIERGNDIEPGDAGGIVLFSRGKEIARAHARGRASAIFVNSPDEIWIGNDYSSELQQFAIAQTGGKAELRQIASIRPQELSLSVQALWANQKLVVVSDRNSRHLYAFARDSLAKPPVDLGVCRGGVDFAQTGDSLFTACLLDHEIQMRSLRGIARGDGSIVARIKQDGPVWSIAALPRAGDGALLAVGSIEDHPLDRSQGFGFVDSYIYMYQLTGTHFQRLNAVNLSEIGAVTPKWIHLEQTHDSVVLTTSGFGSASWVELTWNWENIAQAPKSVARPFLPGLRRATLTPEGWMGANPLTDEWFFRHKDAEDWHRTAAPVPQDSANRSSESKIGELLVFTTLMAPWNSASGMRSVFTCESCHYEGTIDGRVHYTGRETVHATTKPLMGLFNNAPHFTRALDKTMAQMVNNEFTVANRGSGKDPWFSLGKSKVPWLAKALPGLADNQVTPLMLRKSLIIFLKDLSFEKNSLAYRTDGEPASHLTPRSAELFAKHCMACHDARTVTEDASTRKGLIGSEWLSQVADGTLTWASSEYQQTGVLPYVSNLGARTTSLRRVAFKFPLFTNGSAQSVEDVLVKAGWLDDGTFFHDAAPATANRFTAQQISTLAEFVRML